MNSSHPSLPPGSASQFTRRGFLRSTSTAVIGSSLLAGLPLARSVHAAGNDTLKIALIGCGGRGTGAANQALKTPGSTRLVALADVRSEQLEKSLEALKNQQADKIDVPPDRQFTDFDGYKKAITLADVVILASSPGFRPIHFEEAVRQGKHVFMEKPVATDAPGIRQVLAAAEEAGKKNLKVGVGLQRRHQPGYIETIKRIQDGAVGELILLRAYWDGGSRDGVERLPGETEMHYQIRNWYYFTWLSGDHIVEQHVHNLDVVNWIKGAHPVRGQGMGGRQVRNAKRHGQIYDHHFVEFEYADGTRMLSQCRQIPGCWPSISEHVTGTKGSADLANGRFIIKGADTWRFPDRQKRVDPYQKEHDDLFDAIRNNKPFNEAVFGAVSTMTGIMGRMCTYSGQQITWDDAFNSKIELLPKTFGWDATPPVLPDADGFYPVAMPGRTVCV
ncbi:MAG TPA: Gfo/Idh/MocA family oxidoreductase [Verrucomicrobiae bacterium]